MPVARPPRQDTRSDAPCPADCAQALPGAAQKDPKTVERRNGRLPRRSYCSTHGCKKNRSPMSKCKPCQIRPGCLLLMSGRVFLPVRPGYQSRQPFQVYVSRFAGQRLRRLRADRRSTRPAWRRIRNAVDQLQQSGTDGGRQMADTLIELARTQARSDPPAPCRCRRSGQGLDLRRRAARNWIDRVRTVRRQAVRGKRFPGSELTKARVKKKIIGTSAGGVE